VDTAPDGAHVSVARGPGLNWDAEN
jgi:hypothetical protein